MTQDNRLWVLMSRRLSGEASPAEAEELQLMLELSPDKEYLFAILHSYFTVFPSSEEEDERADPGLEKKIRQILEAPMTMPLEDKDNDDMGKPRDARVFHMPVRRIVVYAASIAIAFVLGWGIFRWSTAADVTAVAKAVKGEEVQARAGARTRMILPDGTQVWLNSNSKLKYNNGFTGGVREVGLEGEAYFDVAKDIRRPFIVHTSSLDIKVLGTAFTIKSYAQDETIEATLLCGTIEVTRKDNPNTPRVILKPNEKLVFNKRLPGHSRPVHFSDPVSARSLAAMPDMAVNSIRRDLHDSNMVETAWMYNRLVFSGDTFKELALKMERWYDVKIRIRDESLGRCRFGGAFANETVEDAFKALQLTTAFNYKISGNEIELYAKE